LVAGVRLSVTALSYDGVLSSALLADQAITSLPAMVAGMRSALGPTQPRRGQAGLGFPALRARARMDPVMAGYRHGIDAARRRLAGCPRRILRDPRFGDIEYTQWGQGLR
jgi:hypothetical protein